MADRQAALSVKRTSNLGQLTGCLGMLFGLVFSSIFFGIGAFFFWMIALEPMLKIWDAQSWVTAPCIITKSDVEGDETYRVVIEYDYDFAGVPHSGGRYDFFSMATSGKASKQRIIARYPIGSRHDCYVNPENPDESVLNRGPGSSLFWGLFPLPFMLIGLGGYWFVFFMQRRSREAKPRVIRDQSDEDAISFEPLTAQRVSSQTEWSDSNYDEEDLYEAPGPVTLKPDSSHFVGMIVLGIFGVVWNGIVAIPVFQRFDDWMNLQFKGFEDLFLIPFILVGIGILAAAIYQFLASLNPKPTLILSRQLIPLGGTAQIQWEFTRGTGAIRQLTLSLTGVEQAKYRRGTNTYTDTETFHSEILFDTTDPLEIQHGQTQVSIPTASMHSFQGDNNQITWNLLLKGDIPHWPDINTKFPIRVVPHE